MEIREAYNVLDYETSLRLKELGYSKQLQLGDIVMKRGNTARTPWVVIGITEDNRAVELVCRGFATVRCASVDDVVFLPRLGDLIEELQFRVSGKQSEAALDSLASQLIMIIKGSTPCNMLEDTDGLS